MTIQEHKSIGILLAAGNGTRFDPSGVCNKILVPLAGGISVGVQAAMNLLNVLDRVVVVVRDSNMAHHFQFAGCDPLIFSGNPVGMGASLASAVDYVLASATPDSLLIALGDMPFVQRSTISEVLQSLRTGSEIVQPVFQQQGGHPVGFARRHFAALRSLNGDQGARELLRAFPVTQVVVDDPGILKDIDFKRDLPDKWQEISIN